MNDNNLSKQEYTYLQTIDKQNLLIEKLKHERESQNAALVNSQADNEALKSELGTTKSELEKLMGELAGRKTEAEKMSSEIDTIKEMKKNIEAAYLELDDKSAEEIKALREQLATARNRTQEALTKSQEYVDAAEVLQKKLTDENRTLKNQNFVLRKNQLPETEMEFWRMCKFDTLAEELIRHGKYFTHDELSQIEFLKPTIESVGFEQLTTSNYQLNKMKNGQYELTSI